MSQNPDDLVKIAEIMRHMRELFQIFNEEMSFFDEYLESVTKFDLDKALVCFRNLIRQTEFLRPKGAANGDSTGRSLKKPPIFKRMAKRKAPITKTEGSLLGSVPRSSREYANRRG